MKVIIAGSRGITDITTVEEALSKSAFSILEVVCGGAKGVDLLGAEWAKTHNIPVKYFYAQWDVYGKSAGYIRNEEMARYADALVAIWDGQSSGTKHMINIAKQLGLAIEIPTLNKSTVC